jgi:hypothetical protein
MHDEHLLSSCEEDFLVLQLARSDIFDELAIGFQLGRLARWLHILLQPDR